MISTLRTTAQSASTLPAVSRRRRLGMACACALLAVLATACSEGVDAVTGDPPRQGANRARFTFDCDLQGVNGVLTLDVEAVASGGIVFGPGPNPAITGVIGTENFIYFTAGELVSPNAHYTFTGENDFADFTNLAFPESFLVQFAQAPGGLTLIVNPFGPGPTQVSCVQTGAVFR